MQSNVRGSRQYLTALINQESRLQVAFQPGQIPPAIHMYIIEHAVISGPLERSSPSGPYAVILHEDGRLLANQNQAEPCCSILSTALSNIMKANWDIESGQFSSLDYSRVKG